MCLYLEISLAQVGRFCPYVYKICLYFVYKTKIKIDGAYFFAFFIALGPISSNIYSEKKLELEDPYKNFMSEKIDFRCFRAGIGQKIKNFGLHVKFPKKISLQKKIIYFEKYS